MKKFPQRSRERPPWRSVWRLSTDFKWFRHPTGTGRRPFPTGIREPMFFIASGRGMTPSQGFMLSRVGARGTEVWRVFRETKSLVTIFGSSQYGPGLSDGIPAADWALVSDGFGAGRLVPDTLSGPATGAK